MTIVEFAFLTATCALGQLPLVRCVNELPRTAQVASVTVAAPHFTGESMGVTVSGEAVLAWDWESGTVLYERNADERRPIASLTKLLALLVIREHLAPDAVVTIPPEVARAQTQGAHVRLPVGEHVTVRDLIAAGVIASANDALVVLAHAAAGSEEEFTRLAAAYAQSHGFPNTVPANATGLSGGTQYSTAHEVRSLLTEVFQDAEVGPLLAQGRGVLTTREGSVRQYVTTNKLLGTYVPIVAAKTGYTLEAKENLALLTKTDEGNQVGIVVLGSNDRFQDAKVLLEWLNRNYTWTDALVPARL